MTLFLLAIVITLIIIIVILYAQLKYYKTMDKNTSVLGVLQKIFVTMGANNKTSNQKLEDINNMVLEYFNSKFSTIAWYNGSTFEIKATNVSKSYVVNLTEAVTTNEFRQAMYNNVSKYLTTEGTKTLAYDTAIDRGVKSAMISPLFNNETFVGFWLLEDTFGGAFDNISKEHLANIKNNLAMVMENTNSQQVIENLATTDALTGFKNSMYLYSNGRVMMNGTNSSAIVIINIKDFRDINNKFGRADGDKVLVRVSELIKEMFTGSSEYIRYGSDEFVIVCLNTEALNIYGNIEKAKNRLLSEPLVMSDGTRYKVGIYAACTNYKRVNDLDKTMKDLSNAVEMSKEKDSIEIVQ